MKQVVQHLGDGRTEIIEVPTPASRPGHLIIRTTRSLVSPGTERMLRYFGKANLINKARQQPDKVRQVIGKIGTDGLVATMEAVRAKMDQPIPLGYCNVGVVIDADSADGFKAGDRVASNGPHAEMVRVPKNLAVRVPDNVDDETASFTVLGAIALEGIRLAQPTLGECIAVIGLGLVGLLSVQLLRAQGVRVLGVDLDPQRCALAAQAGAETVCISNGEDPVARAMAFSRGRGMDAMLICAATKSNEPIIQSAQMARIKGRVVLVGVVGMDVPRDEFFRKELSFQVSCSYGPGRYDPTYEDKGQDYPVGYVRWTAQRNFEAVLDMMAAGSIDVQAYINRRAPIAEAAQAYEALDTAGSSLGILFDYPSVVRSQTQVEFGGERVRAATKGSRFAVIGAGNYAQRQLMPVFTAAGGVPMVACGTGTPAEVHAARKYGFARAGSNSSEVMAAGDVDLVLIATRHNNHAALVVEGLKAGKAVFVEKPLAMNSDELQSIAQAYRGVISPFLMVGFNRRFSPHVIKLRSTLERAGAPPAIGITINAGAIPANHWTQDRTIGGGRIIGEACHFIDLARYLAGAPITDIQAAGLGEAPSNVNLGDNAAITLRFANGAVATIQYLANGHPSLPKERVEVFCGGRVWRIDNFRRLVGFGVAGSPGRLFGGQDKGQGGMARAVLEALKSGTSAPIPFEQLMEVSSAAIEIDARIRGGAA